MKKSYLALGLVAAVAMSSCSNDEPMVNPNQQNPAKDLVPVELGLTSASADVNVGTRGTGTVGGMDVASNQWQYEDIYVLMTSRDTSSLEAKDFTNAAGEKQATGWGLTSVKGDGPFLKHQFDGTFWARPESSSSSVLGTNLNYFIDKNEWWNAAPINKYYPMNGVSEFFAYYVDDACDLREASEHNDDHECVTSNMLYARDQYDNYQEVAHAYPVITRSADENSMSIQYQIDGTQDLMWGHADNNSNGYSAKTARQNITPSITMQHLLTRLTFNIIKGAESTNMVKLNGIRVKSRNQGTMYVAFDTQTVTDKDVNSILAWNEDENVEDATFSLMQYKTTVKVLGTKCLDEDGEEITVSANFPTTDPESGEETENFVPCPLLYMETANGMDFRFEYDGRFFALTSPNLKEGTVAEAMDKVVRETPPAPSLANGKSTLVTFEPIALSTIANVGESLEVGEAMFVKPGVTELKLELDLTMTVRNENELFYGVEDPYTSTELQEHLLLPLTIKTPAGMTFMRGKSYQINITVYGLEKVKIFVVPEAWQDGGDINIGGDNDAEFGTWFNADGEELDANGQVVPGENENGNDNAPSTGDDTENDENDPENDPSNDDNTEQWPVDPEGNGEGA